MRMDSLQRIVGWAWMPLFLALAIPLPSQVYPDGPIAPEGYQYPAKFGVAWDPNPPVEKVIGYRIYGSLTSGGPYHLLSTELNHMVNTYSYTTNFSFTEEVVDVGGGFFETNVVTVTNVSQHVTRTLVAQDTDSVITNMMRDSTIYFVATAYNAWGESVFSNEVSAKSITPAPPGSPLLIEAREPDLVAVTFTMRDTPILVQKSSDLTNWTEFALLELIQPYPEPVLVSVLLPTAYEPMAYLRVEPPASPAPN